MIFSSGSRRTSSWRHAAARRALTLVELLIVIAIISVATAIALPVTRGLIEESRITESVRTVRAYLENARARAMNTGREHGVAFTRAGATSLDQQGTVTSLSLVSGAPGYRGDMEGARCWVYHEDDYASTTAYGPNGAVSGTPPAASLGQFANAAVFDPVQCPTLRRTFDVVSGATPGAVPPIQFGDLLVLGGQRFRIFAISNCDGSEPPFSSGGVNPSDWIKIYFDPRGDTGEVNVATGGAVVSVAEPPVIPLGGHQVINFEILRTRLRGNGSNLQLARGAAVDLFFSGAGVSGSEFSPLGTYDSSISDVMPPIIVVFAPSGEVSRVVTAVRSGSVYVPVSAFPRSTLHFLVGRSDQIRPDLLAPTLNLTDSDPDNMSNIMDPESTWVSINPLNGRITTSDMIGARGVPTSIAGRIYEARRPAVLAREDNQ